MAKLGISTGITPNDGTGDSLLEGAIKINSNFDEIYNYFGDGTNLDFSGDVWGSSNLGVSTTLNVGIGTTAPRFSLEVGSVGSSGTSLFVNGNTRVTGILTVGTSNNNIILNGSSNRITVGSNITLNGSTGNVSLSSLTLGGVTATGFGVTVITAGTGITVDQNTGNVTISAVGSGVSFITVGSGLSIDQNTGSVTLTNTIPNHWEQTTSGINTLSNVGIGTTNPTSALTVSGLTSTTNLYVSGITTFGNNISFPSNQSSLSRLEPANSLLVLDNITLNGSLDGILSSAENIILSSGVNKQIILNSAGQRYLIGNPANSVELFYNDFKKFETSDLGIVVVGIASAEEFVIGSEVGITSTGSIFTGIVTATSFVGDGSNLTGIGIGIASESVLVGTGVSLIDFKGSGITTSVFSSGIATVNIEKTNYINELIDVGISTNILDGQALIWDSNISSWINSFVVSSYFVSNNSGIHTLSNVGIGTTTATSKLTVDGDGLVSGALTAGLFVGDGSGLTNVIATGSGIEIKDDNSVIGVAATINFGDRLTVTPVSAGVVTVTSIADFYWEKTSAGINTVSNVGIATTNPQTPLQVENIYGVKTGIGTFNASVGIAYTVDSFTISSNDFKTVEYTIHIGFGTYIQAQKVLAIQNGSTAYSQEYGIMYHPDLVVSIGATVVGGQFRLEVIPEPGISGLTTYRFTRHSML